MKRLSSLFLGFALVVGGMGISTEAKAEGFSLSDWSARGMSLAGGLVARGGDASTVAYNPAAMTRLPGLRMMLGGTMQSPMSKVETVQGGVTTTTKVKRNYWLAPHAFATYQVNDSLWVGAGIFSRYGMGNAYPSNWPGRYNLVDVSLQTVTFNPNLAWKMTDKLSMAVGIEMMGAMMEMNKDQRFSPTISDRQKMDGFGMTFGMNVALHYQFNDQWAAGFTWRSPMMPNVEGKSKWTNQVALKNSDLHGTLRLPESVAFAVAYKPLNNLSFEVGTVFTRWSRYNSLDITLENIPVHGMNVVSKNPKNWKNTWAFNVSVEYQPIDWMTLRAGYLYETSPISKYNADYMAPTNGRHRFNLGMGFAWQKWTMDVAYSYIKVKSLSYNASNANGTPGILAGHTRGSHSHGLALSVGYTF